MVAAVGMVDRLEKDKCGSQGRDWDSVLRDSGMSPEAVSAWALTPYPVNLGLANRCIRTASSLGNVIS